MRREANIPLFLWIATALLVHLMSGGGAEQVARTVEGVREIGKFARSVQWRVQGQNATTEISLLEEPRAEDAEKPEEPKQAPESEKEPLDAAKEAKERELTERLPDKD